MTARKTKQEKPKFYDLKAILIKNADYNVIFGERSNGKTYAALKYGLENYIKTGKQTFGPFTPQTPTPRPRAPPGCPAL